MKDEGERRWKKYNKVSLVRRKAWERSCSSYQKSRSLFFSSPVSTTSHLICFKLTRCAGHTSRCTAESEVIRMTIVPALLCLCAGGGAYINTSVFE